MWALRHYAYSALAVALVVAAGMAAAAPELALLPRLHPVPDAGWGMWTSLAVGPEEARAQALSALIGAMRVAGVAVLGVSALTVLSLAVARTAERRTEIVVRRTVGASRGALTVAALTEGVVIAGAGLVAGGIAAVLATTALWRAWPAAMHATMAGLSVVLVVLGGAVVMGALFPIGFARHRMPGSDAGPRGVPLLVPACQFALALIGLLAGARLASLTSKRAPVVAGAVGAVVPLSFGADGHDSPALAAAWRRLRNDPTVRLASLSSPGTLIGLGQVDVVTTECGRCTQGGIATPLRVVQATNHLASADTFRALDLRVLAGRSLTDADRWGAAPVAVVNRYLAERAFESGRAVGRQVRVGGPDSWYRVVGIVDDGRFDAIGAGATPPARVYLSVWQHRARELEVLVRGVGPLAATALAPGARVGPVSPESEWRAREAGAAHWFATILTYAGWGGLVLAVIGMVAVMRIWIAGAVPELALRRAVGARRRHVLGRVAVRALAVVGGGAALTWWLEPVAAAALARAVPGLPAGAPALVAGPFMILTIAALAAVAGPAWRTAPTDL